MKVKPFRGKLVRKKDAKKFKELLAASKKPDLVALKKESDEFINYIKAMRSTQES